MDAYIIKITNACKKTRIIDIFPNKYCIGNRYLRNRLSEVNCQKFKKYSKKILKKIGFRTVFGLKFIVVESIVQPNMTCKKIYIDSGAKCLSPGRKRSVPLKSSGGNVQIPLLCSRHSLRQPQLPVSSDKTSSHS